MNLSAANQLAITESASQSITAITTIAAVKNVEKQSKTAAKSASKSYTQIVVADNQEQN